MVDQGQQITQAVSIPVIGDGDNGYGNAMNVKRTVKGYIKAGFAGIILEDQIWFREQQLQDDAFSIQKMTEKLASLEKENAELRRRQSDHPLEPQQSPDRRSPNPDIHSSDPPTDV